MGERDMNKLMKIVHPEEKHDLSFREGSLPFSQTCHKCAQKVSRDYYSCIKDGCGEYHLHKECVELKDLFQFHHPLHPQHPLVIHSNFPYDKSFKCSFCGETKQSRSFYQCSDDQCEFYLDNTYERDFIGSQELLDKYEIQHVFHDHENHRLSPTTRSMYYGYEYEAEYQELIGYSHTCAGCGNFVEYTEWVYKCTGCDFYLHIRCSQVPKEVQHYSHPQHPFFLLQNPPAASDQESKQLRCNACLKWMEDEFYLNCTRCPTFNLDLQCYFRKPNVKHGAHEHPLAYFLQIYDDDALCYACNASCKCYLFRCFTCNFNIHHDCLALPFTVNYDDHVHPLTLTPSFKEDEHPTAYYCDICEKRRDPNHGIYLCEECPFIAHFECALSLSATEEEAYAHATWRQKLEDDNHTLDKEEDMRLTNKQVSVEILDQLNEEIDKLRDVMEQLFVKKGDGEQLTQKIEEFEERHANAEDMLRRLKQSVKRSYI